MVHRAPFEWGAVLPHEKEQDRHMKRPTKLVAATLAAAFAAPGLAHADASKVAATAFKLEEATIGGIHGAMEAGRLSCAKLTQLYLERIRTYEDAGIKLNSITTVNKNAMRKARALDREFRRDGLTGPLHCIPVLLKDNVDTVDMPTTNGSVILEGSYAPNDAFITKRLRDQGALILGKAAMGEFAGGSYNTIDGQVVNPYHLKRQTGGSSAGSGAAIAANLGVLAIGTDTSTSVRGPAAYNGIVGLRPTTGLISRDGIAPKNLQFDTAGPMARTVTDTALMFNAVAAQDATDPLSPKAFAGFPNQIRAKAAKGRLDWTDYLSKDALKGKRLGAVRDFFGGDPEIDAMAEKALDKMRELGAEIIDINLDPQFLDFYVRNGGPNIRTIADYRFKADWEKYTATLGPKVPKTVEELIQIYETRVKQVPLPVEDSVLNLLKRSVTTNTEMPAYKNLVDNILPEATRLKLAMFQQYNLDAMVFPYQTSFASPIRNPAFAIDDPTFVRSTRLQPSIFAGYSSVGFPGVVVPMGIGSQGLPMTISFMGKPHSDGAMLGYAYAYEQASKLRRPSPLVPPLKGETIPAKAARKSSR